MCNGKEWKFRLTRPQPAFCCKGMLFVVAVGLLGDSFLCREEMGTGNALVNRTPPSQSPLSGSEKAIFARVPCRVQQLPLPRPKKPVTETNSHGIRQLFGQKRLKGGEPQLYHGSTPFLKSTFSSRAVSFHTSYLLRNHRATPALLYVMYLRFPMVLWFSLSKKQVQWGHHTRGPSSVGLRRASQRASPDGDGLERGK